MQTLDIASHPRLSELVELISSPRLADPLEALPFLIYPKEPGHARAYLHVSTAGLPAGHFRLAHVDLEGRDLTVPSALHRDGVIASLVRTPNAKIVHHLDLRHDPAAPPALAAYRSAMAAPVFSDGIASDWAILLDMDAEAFTVAELENLVLRTSLVATAASNLRVTQQLCDANLKVQREIDQIAQIQRALLPEELPDIPGLGIAASYSPVRDAGGDMYDFLPLRNHSSTSAEVDERWAMVIGDVSGHGPAAACVMAMFHSILHAFPQRPDGPADVLAHLNRHLCAKRIGRTFITAFLAFYDPKGKTLTYARAGHNPPLLSGMDGSVSYLEEFGDLPLGIVPDSVYEQGTVQLSPGQRLVMYTDGLIEALSPGGSQFTTAQLERIVSNRTETPEQTLGQIRSALRQHEGESPQGDDQTVVAIHVVE